GCGVRLRLSAGGPADGRLCVEARRAGATDLRLHFRPHLCRPQHDRGSSGHPVQSTPEAPTLRHRMIGIARHRITVGGLVGATIVAVNLLAAILAPVLAPYGQADLVGEVWAPPSSQFWLGLDSIGRDMLSRLLFGARTTISIALLITICSFAIGIVTGFAAAIIGGWIDTALSRFIDAVMAIPTLIFALIILS